MSAWRQNLRSIIVIGSVIGGIVAASYPVIIAPYMNPDPWRQVQSIGREGIDREKIQPGGMKVWTDPFGRKKE